MQQLYRFEHVKSDGSTVSNAVDLVTDGGSKGENNFLAGDGKFKQVTVKVFIFPTEDPKVAGAWWNDHGNLTLSAG